MSFKKILKHKFAFNFFFCAESGFEVIEKSSRRRLDDIRRKCNAEKKVQVLFSMLYEGLDGNFKGIYKI